jgi:hypothetical protein
MRLSTTLSWAVDEQSSMPNCFRAMAVLPPDPRDQGDTGDVLHVRMSKGQANTQRGIRRFCDVLVPRVRRAGATGELSCGAGGVRLSVASRRPRL